MISKSLWRWPSFWASIRCVRKIHPWTASSSTWRCCSSPPLFLECIKGWKSKTKVRFKKKSLNGTHLGVPSNNANGWWTCGIFLVFNVHCLGPSAIWWPPEIGNKTWEKCRLSITDVFSFTVYSAGVSQNWSNEHPFPVAVRCEHRNWEQSYFQGLAFFKAYPRKLTYLLKIDGWKMMFPFKTVPFQGTC